MTPTVVLLHGLLRTAASMRPLTEALERAGFATAAITYPSRQHDLAGLADWVGAEIERRTSGPLIAVTHSLGGIVFRQLGARFDWRGAVMLAPPNQGSAAARVLHRYTWFRRLYGPVVNDLVAPSAWPLAPCPLRVIAGTRRLSIANPTSWMLPAFGPFATGEPHDGTVALSETAHPGADVLVVPATHTWIMNHPDVIHSVLEFVRHASESQRGPTPAPPGPAESDACATSPIP